MWFRLPCNLPLGNGWNDQHRHEADGKPGDQWWKVMMINHDSWSWWLWQCPRRQWGSWQWWILQRREQTWPTLQWKLPAPLQQTTPHDFPKVHCCICKYGIAFSLRFASSYFAWYLSNWFFPNFCWIIGKCYFFIADGICCNSYVCIYLFDCFCAW